MTFQDLIALHCHSLRNPQPIPVQRRNRVHRAPSRQIYSDWADI